MKSTYTYDWTDMDVAMNEFQALIDDPPVHSVVITIGPEVAEWLLKLTNEKNRPIQHKIWQMYAGVIRAEKWPVTGDTIKFGTDGRLLDGQHRLKACGESGGPLTTHVVFGIDDHVFDCIDDGKKRTPGDVLGIDGVKGASIIAGAIRWVERLAAGGAPMRHVPNAHILSLYRDKHATLAEHAAIGQRVRIAYGHPPSLITALSYLIARHDKRLADEFFAQWLDGPRTGRNQGFSVLQSRLQTVAHESGGHISSVMRAAMIITAFNYWHAGETPSARALTWRKSWRFPELNFSGKLAREQGKPIAEARASKGKQDVLTLLDEGLSQHEVARRLNISKRQVQYISDTARKTVEREIA